MKMKWKPFIDDLLSAGFDDFVTLYFPGPRPLSDYTNDWELLREALRDLTDETRRAARQQRLDRAEKCHQRWLAEVRGKAPANEMRYISVIERRASKRDVMFHVLLGGCDWAQYDFSDWWGPRWTEISGGRAFMRNMDERTGGLLRYFVFKAHCVLEVDCGRVQGRFRAQDFEDFEEWNPY
jgi:hypothetical protein